MALGRCGEFCEMAAPCSGSRGDICCGWQNLLLAGVRWSWMRYLIVVWRRLSHLVWLLDNDALKVSETAMSWSCASTRVEDRYINKLQNDFILLIFKIWKFGNIRFVRNLIGDIYWNFYDDDIMITVMSLVLRTHFSMYRPNSSKHLSHHTLVWPHEGIDPVIVASVVETTRRPGSSSSSTLSRPWANFLHQTCIAGLVKYLSLYTGRISDWMAFALSHFAHSIQITEGCSVWDDFNGNVALFHLYK